MKYVASNYGSIGTLDDAITSSETEFDVTGSSAKIANLASGESYLLCLGDPAGTREFIRCSTFSSNHFAGVTRGFESAKNGGIARGWPSGTPVTMIISAAYLDNVIQKGGIDWNDYPKGHCQPFFASIVGMSLSTFLATYTNWRKLDNTQISDIEGRAMAVSSSSHVSDSQTGSDDAIVPLHNHGTTELPHSHGAKSHDAIGPALGFSRYNSASSSEDIYYTELATTGITINNAGEPITNKNIQRTQYQDWIIKIA
jgi:hypothetical protein